MSVRQKTTSVVVGEQAFQLLRQIAAERTEENRRNGHTSAVYVSDLMREAVEDYLKQRGYGLTIVVTRGGYRGDKPAKETGGI